MSVTAKLCSSIFWSWRFLRQWVLASCRLQTPKPLLQLCVSATVVTYVSTCSQKKVFFVQCYCLALHHLFPVHSHLLLLAICSCFVVWSPSASWFLNLSALVSSALTSTMSWRLMKVALIPCAARKRFLRPTHQQSQIWWPENWLGQIRTILGQRLKIHLTPGAWLGLGAPEGFFGFKTF